MRRIDAEPGQGRLKGLRTLQERRNRRVFCLFEGFQAEVLYVTTVLHFANVDVRCGPRNVRSDRDLGEGNAQNVTYPVPSCLRHSPQSGRNRDWSPYPFRLPYRWGCLSETACICSAVPVRQVSAGELLKPVIEGFVIFDQVLLRFLVDRRITTNSPRLDLLP